MKNNNELERFEKAINRRKEIEIEKENEKKRQEKQKQEAAKKEANEFFEKYKKLLIDDTIENLLTQAENTYKNPPFIVNHDIKGDTIYNELSRDFLSKIIKSKLKTFLPQKFIKSLVVSVEDTTRVYWKYNPERYVDEVDHTDISCLVYINLCI